jgi:hypothetical protein
MSIWGQSRVSSPATCSPCSGGPIRFDSTDSYVDGLQARAERHRIEGTLRPEDYPQAMLGQLLILRTQKHTATAKVITSTREMNLGDRVASR